nr:hypothetical protein Iba_chr14dCG2710 [Ipomoea batatas]
MQPLTTITMPSTASSVTASILLEIAAEWNILASWLLIQMKPATPIRSDLEFVWNLMSHQSHKYTCKCALELIAVKFWRD